MFSINKVFLYPAALFVFAMAFTPLFAQGGAVESFPAYDDSLIPGLKEAAPSTVSEESVSGAAGQAELPPQKSDSQNPSGEDSGGSWLDPLLNGDRSVFNAIFLILLIILFLLYRLRTGNNRRSF